MENIEKRSLIISIMSFLLLLFVSPVGVAQAATPCETGERCDCFQYIKPQASLQNITDTQVKISVSNLNSYSYCLFWPWKSHLKRMQLTIYDKDTKAVLNSFYADKSIQVWWFPKTRWFEKHSECIKPLPCKANVYVELWDMACNLIYTSDPITFSLYK